MKKSWIPLLASATTLAPLVYADTYGSYNSPLAAQPNLRFGPIDFNLTGTFTTEYNDNILSSPEEFKIRDLILTPGFNFAGTWKLTKFNTIKLNIGLGYKFYLQHPELGSSSKFVTLSPDTKLSLKMKMGAFTVTPYNSLSFSSDATGVPGVDAATLANQTATSYSRFNNEAGVDITWHCNRKLEPYLHLYRTDVIPIKGTLFNYTKRYQYTANPGFNYQLATNLRLGLDLSINRNKYKINFQNSSTSFNLGPTASLGIKPNMTLSGSAGYSWSKFNQNGNNQDSSNPQSLSWNISFQHTLRPNLQYSVFTSQGLTYGYIANMTRTRDVGISTQWRAFKNTTLRAAIVNQHGRDSGGFFAEKYHSLTNGIGVDYAMNSRSTLSFDYEHTKKSSDRSLRAYSQNRFICGLAYDF